MTFKKISLAAALLLAGLAQAQTTVVSTQMTPVEEAEKMRKIILKGAPDAVNFVTEPSNTYFTRMQAELGSATGKVHVTLALDGEFSPLDKLGALQDVGDLARKLGSSREFDAAALGMGKLDGQTQKFIPLMANTLQMVANKKALPYLPKGANLNSLTYPQLRDWAKAMKDATGEAKLGYPAGPRGLMHRFFQASFYPSHTGGIVRTFKNADAEKAWADLREMWAYVHPRSTSYGIMEEPLQTGEVWVAFDHTARLLPALTASPNDYVTFPAPSGAKGRGYMPILAGLAIPKNTPDRAAAERLIDHLTKPATQATTLREIGFFPAVKADIKQLPPGVQLASQGMTAVFAAKDGVKSMLPVQLGAKGGEFNKVYLDTFARIVLRKEDIKTVLREQAVVLDAIMKESDARCWAPDAPGAGVCQTQ
jgi:multiple sugar transport system substrate-binding protein